MLEEPAGVYLPTADDNVYESTRLARAFWYEDGQHGGALAALVGAHVDKTPTLTPMSVSRLTLEIFRIVPLVPLRLETSVAREGKRIQVLDIQVTSPDGLELAQAHVQRLREAEVGLPVDLIELETPFPAPASFQPLRWRDDFDPKSEIMFHSNAVEVREIEGGFFETGPGSIWMRVIKPIVAGRPITPLQRMAVIADFCNGVARPSAEADWLFMNPDLTVHVSGHPSGEWVALSAESIYSPNGRGIATGTLWDETRYLGRSTQTLYIDRIT